MCPSCGSNNQSEFLCEMIIHSTLFKLLGKPGVWANPKLLICLDCGFSSFTAPQAELQQAGLSSPNWGQTVAP
jgi:hypothetical protein